MNPTLSRSSRLMIVFVFVLVLVAIRGSMAQVTLADHTADPASVAIVGDLQSELSCPGDWQPDCISTELTYDGNDEIWQATFNVPAGFWLYKAALNDSWDENYGAGAVPNGDNIGLNLGAADDVKFYYDHETHWVTDNVNSRIATAAGSFQSELGCPGDWAPDCLRSWLQDPDGDGTYTFTTSALPEGSYEFKVAINEEWTESYGAGGGGDNIPFTVPSLGSQVTISFVSATNNPSVEVASSGLEPGDAELVTPPVRQPGKEEFIYFVMTDRFANGDPSNDQGDSASTDPLVNGYLVSDKGYYHGGDLAGLQDKLDYLDGLGVTALWITPPFANRWVQGDGTIAGSSAAYHGYWQIDLATIDPHLGTNQEMLDLVNAAHALGMKVYFDIVVNHTGDVIQYVGGGSAYRNKTDYPYKDASGTEFDDRDYAGGATFPPLDPAVSFPYEPAYATLADETIKAPAFLNDPTLYHNRGNSTFSGENSLYGDFFGLDDLFTEHPAVVDGMIDAHEAMIATFGIDGFRVDTVKHVNDEFWEAFVPAIQSYAASEGSPDFVIFGEIYDGDPGYLSRFSTELPFPTTLDFRFDGTVKGVVASSSPTDNLRNLFADDNWFTDDDSNAYALVKFVGNHDVGRVGRDIQVGNAGASDSELLARAALVQALNFTTRGVPIVYYGDEQGFTGDAGDKDARQDMFPSQVPSYNDDNLIGTAATTADDNFDVTHPLYQTISDLAALRDAHPALRTGAQLHRFSEGTAGIYAFSRLDRSDPVEYIVAVNTSESADSATFTSDTPDATFTEIYPGTGPATASNSAGEVTVNVPALGVVVYQAGSPVPTDTTADGIAMAAPASGDEVEGRVEVSADVTPGTYAEVTFAVSIEGGAYEVIGTDDNAPYAVYHDVSGLPSGTSVTYKAIVADLGGNLNAAKVTVTVKEEIEPPPPSSASAYAVIHYLRTDGDYGDHTTGDYNDYWGLHLWGDITETIEWTAPKPFLGEDEYGRFAWVSLAENATNMGFIVHRGDTKDGTDADRFFNPSVTPEIWLRQDDATIYTSQADAQGYVTIRYHRDDGDYGTPSNDYNTFWGLHLWGDAIDPGEGTEWTSPKPPTGIDDYGAYWSVAIVDSELPVNFIIHRGDTKDPGPDQSMIPSDDATIWIQSSDETIYPSRGAAENTVVLHYYRPAGDYGDYSSTNFNDFWGMHVWEGSASPTEWPSPVKPVATDIFGPVFNVPLADNATQLAYILHRGDEKDPGPDQFLVLEKWGFEVWQLQGEGPNPDEPHYVLPVLAGAGSGNPGNINQQSAFWVDDETIAWGAAANSGLTYTLHYAPEGGLATTEEGITGGSSITLTPGALSNAVKAKFPHLAGLPGLKIAAGDLAVVPEILKGQIAVSAVNSEGVSVDATGLQIPGVLDDLYTYNGDLGVSWNGNVPTIRLWAPTAKSVTFHLFDDANPSTSSTTTEMAVDAGTGVWSITGDASWKNKYYLFEVEVYVHSTGQVEHNIVTDPYSFSLAMNSSRSQIVNLDDSALKPPGWETLAKPPIAAPEEISVYEIHVRDFSVNDSSVPDAMKGTYKAFTLDNTNGTNHLKALQEAGLTYLHLLPVFDIATIDENKANWQEPDPAVLATYPPDSEQQQAAVTATEDLDGFNWGYDPFHYTVPEGSYSTDPDGTTRIREFREMVQSLNEDVGLRVVMDVVYNHTNAAGQAEKSVLDRIVPGYYHRLNDKGAVETSTCCANTASEHNMMEKLMVDSLLVWATEYKIDAFRFDLMGHHMKSNILNVRDALDSLTPAADGVDGEAIYMYGEGWNFGEVADNARGVNATQLNMAGTGIGTFSDRLRDAVRGGGPFDGGQDLIRRQGFANGLFYDPNVLNSGSQGELDTLLLTTDQIRIGMAGNLATYEFIDRNGNLVTGAQVDYNGQPAGYTLDPQENISYISKHDNQTLYDNNAYKLPVGTTMEDRVRAQAVGLSTVLLGQGVPFTHAGSDLLRSKSLDRDSFNSGDWFNRLDFTYQASNWGVGLPVASKNQDNWGIMGPLLANPSLQPAPSDIMLTTELFQELLEVRASSELFHLKTAAEIQDRVAFHNTGPSQLPGLIVMSVSDLAGTDLDRYYEAIVVLVNANDEAQAIAVGDLIGIGLQLHPVQAASVDPIVRTSSFDTATGTFEVPGRTTAVFVLQETTENLIDMLKDDVQTLVDDGDLAANKANVLFVKLDNALKELAKGKPDQAIKQMEQLIHEVNILVQQGNLAPEDGAALIQEATIIIAELSAGN